ncbi:MBL fold metallo-hydrolase [Aurantimonas marina]|uniref:MBL fold metallo-hydrolase n=1 Tax=Aurantimonas marina TaxID=2780508 RepID=UPI0019D1EFAB|nr:MBL fold metallo-hydrolase [Aurantimonas marina]
MISRRTFNRALLAGLAAPLLPTVAGNAFASTDGGTLTTVSDGNLVLPLNFVLPDIPKAELEALEGAAFIQSGELTPPCNLTLVRLQDRLVLFDAGSGPNFMPSAGRLIESLAAADLDPGAITDVVFTHAHPDHIWGVVDDFDEVVFPQAAFHISGTEWDFWRAEETLAAAPDDRKSFVVGARSRFDAIEERSERFQPGTEIIPGIEAMGTPGHTPGHTAFVIHALDEPAVVVGDAISNDPVSFARPDWHWGADQDPEEGASTRRRLLDRLAAEKLQFVGFHLPDGGIGRVEVDGAAFRFVPAV